MVMISHGCGTTCGCVGPEWHVDRVEFKNVEIELSCIRHLFCH